MPLFQNHKYPLLSSLLNVQSKIKSAFRYQDVFSALALQENNPLPEIMLINDDFGYFICIVFYGIFFAQVNHGRFGTGCEEGFRRRYANPGTCGR
jgi:hypothetical protein